MKHPFGRRPTATLTTGQDELEIDNSLSLQPPILPSTSLLSPPATTVVDGPTRFVRPWGFLAIKMDGLRKTKASSVLTSQ